MNPLKRVYHLLRSRRVAIWLIAAFVAYAALAAVTAKEGAYGAPYSNPIFLTISAALTLATAACALERTVGAVRAWRGTSQVSEAFVEGLRTAPRTAISLDTGADPGAALITAGETLRGMHLRVRKGRDRLAAGSSRLGLVGSPLFHWSLVLLFIFIGAGQLSRSEGLMGVPVGQSVLDSKDAYGNVTEGPLHTPGFTGLTFAVPEITLGYVAGGVDRGASPIIEVYDGPELVRRRQVYPNSPLRYKSLLIHANNYGLTGHFVIESGESTAAVDVLYDFKDGSGVAAETSPIGITRSGEPLEFSSEVALDPEGTDWSWAVPAQQRVSWTIVESGETTSGVAAIGDRIDLGDGLTLKLESLGYYARLSVVDDWSVTPIYILFVLAGIGLTLALLLPHRTAWVMLVEKDGRYFLHAKTRQSRGDRLFPDRVEEALQAALTSEGGAL